jgi:thiol-disulfide isomerase/thioredoxin
MCSKRDMTLTDRGRWTRRGLCGRFVHLGILTLVAAATTMRAVAADAGVTVVPVDHAGVMAEVARHRGKVVVLDCWSTSCPPCVKEFPELVRLADAHPDDVVCLSLALDYDGIGTPEEVVPRVRGFLERVAARRVVNLIATEEADAMFRKLDLVGVPAVFVWRADGTLAVRYDDDHATAKLGRPFTYADVEATVAGLLGETVD